MSRLYLFWLWLVCTLAIFFVWCIHLFQSIRGSDRRAYNISIAIDQAANAALSGSPDETISARAHRMKWVKREKIINWLFRDSKHCEKAFKNEVSRKQMPKEYQLEPEGKH